MVAIGICSNFVLHLRLVLRAADAMNDPLRMAAKDLADARKYLLAALDQTIGGDAPGVVDALDRYIEAFIRVESERR
jgi:hypothetical protein